jgi:TonB family protein
VSSNMEWGGKKHWRLLWIVVSVLALSNCANDGVAPSGVESTTGPALVRALPMIAVAATQLPDYWQLTEALELQAPASSGRNLQFGCVAVNFGIDAEGRTFDIQVRKSYPQGRFADTVLTMVRDWHYEPTESNPIRQPVRTSQLLTLQAVEGDVRLVAAEHVAKFCR